MPESAYRFCKKGLKEENGDSASAWNTRGYFVRPTLEHNMKYDLVVTRICKVPVESPIDKCPVNFYIAVIGCSVNSNNRVAKVGSSIGIEVTGLDYLHRPAISCFEAKVIKILAAPDMAEEPFMNIEREFTHGKS